MARSERDDEEGREVRGRHGAVNAPRAAESKDETRYTDSIYVNHQGYINGPSGGVRYTWGCP